MRKNYFAKKFVAYTMAFAVAFSTVTVSPLFVKEAKAAATPYTGTFADGKAPANKIATDEAVWIESMTSDNSAGTQITTGIFAKGAGITEANLGNTTVTVAADQATLTNAVTTASPLAATTVTSKDADATDAGPEKIENVYIDGKVTSDITLKATGAAKWFKLEPVEGTFTVGKDTITYKYYKLRALNSAASDEYNVKRTSKNLGLYVSAKADGAVVALHYLSEVTDLNAEIQGKKDEVLVKIGNPAKISVNVTEHKSLRNVEYKWSKDGKELTGKTDSSLTFASVTEDDLGVYRCDVTDGIEKRILTTELSEMTYNDVKTANTNKVATTFQTVAAVLGETGTSNAGKFDGGEATFTTSLPKGDYKYIWLNHAGTGAVPMSETDTLEYSANNRTVKVTDNALYTGKTIKCYAVPTSVYDADVDPDNGVQAKLKLVEAAKTPSEKVTAIGNLRTAEKRLVASAEYVEVINLYNVDESTKYSSENKTVNFGQTVTLDAVTATSNDNKNIQYQWYRDTDGDATLDKIATGAKYTIDTVDANDLGNIVCKAVKCKDGHTCPTTGTTGCDFAIDALDANVLHTANYNLVYVSDLTASASDVTAKDGETNVVLSAKADSSLKINYGWKNPAGAGVNSTTPGSYTISKVNGVADFYEENGKKPYTCEVSDGIRTILLPIKISEVTTYSVFLNEANKDANKYAEDGTYTLNTTTHPNTASFVGLEGDEITLAPIVVAANEDIEKTITYKWTKTSANGTEVSTDKTFTVAYPKTPTVYFVTVSDGIKKVTLKYTVGQYDPKGATNIDANSVNVVGAESKVVYNGEAQNPLKVTATVNTGASTITLKEGVDYTIDVTENINVGTAFYGNVKLIGDYKGENTDVHLAGLKGVFYITKADNEVVLANTTSATPKVTKNLAKATLTYTYFSDAEGKNEIEAPTKAGVYYVQANAIATANYNAAVSNIAKVVIAPAVAKNFKLAARGTNSIKASWAKVAGAKGYRVYQKVNGSWVRKADIHATSYTFTGLKAGTTYNFAVKPYLKDGNTPVWAKTYTGLTAFTKPAKVVGFKVAAKTKTTVKTTWSKTTGATMYRVYKVVNGKWVKVKDVTGTSYKFTGLKKNTSYKFAVKAFKSGVAAASYPTLTTRTTK